MDHLTGLNAQVQLIIEIHVDESSLLSKIGFFEISGGQALFWSTVGGSLFSSLISFGLSGFHNLAN